MQLFTDKIGEAIGKVGKALRPRKPTRPVVLGVTETSCLVPGDNAVMIRDITKLCKRYEDLSIILNVFDSPPAPGGHQRAFNCGDNDPKLPQWSKVGLPTCIKKITHIPGMKGAFWRYAVDEAAIRELAPGAEVIWLFDNDMRISPYRFDLLEAASLLLESQAALGQPMVGRSEDYLLANRSQTQMGEDIPPGEQLGVRSVQAPAVGSPAVGSPAVGGPAVGQPAVGAPAANMSRASQKSGESIPLLAAQYPLEPPGCRAVDIVWLEVQTPMFAADAYILYHRKVLQKLVRACPPSTRKMRPLPSPNWPPATCRT